MNLSDMQNQTPAINSPYCLYESYDIRDSFIKQPGNIKQCIICECALSEISMSLYPKYVDGSVSSARAPAPTFGFGYHQIWLYVCDHCRWWYIRENFGDNEFSLDLDYITVGIKPPFDDYETRKIAEPWLIALSDETLYEKSLALPSTLKELLSKCHWDQTKR